MYIFLFKQNTAYDTRISDWSSVVCSSDLTTGGLFGAGGEIRFNGASGSTSAITVNGAINANVTGSPGSSYVALVAPRVVQAGAVRVDGSAEIGRAACKARVCPYR